MDKKMDESQPWKVGGIKGVGKELAGVMGYLMGYAGDFAKKQQWTMDEIAVSPQSFGVDAKESFAVRKYQQERNSSSYKKGLVGALVIGSLISPPLGALMVVGHVMTSGYAGRVATKALLGVMAWGLGLGSQALNAMAGELKTAQGSALPVIPDVKEALDQPKGQVEVAVAKSQVESTVGSAPSAKRQAPSPANRAAGPAMNTQAIRIMERI